MSYVMNILPKLTSTAMVIFLASAMPVTADDHSMASGGAAALEIEATVLSIDEETRELDLGLQAAARNTLYVPENVNIAAVSVGDQVVGTYIAASETELRTPTDEDLANPFEIIAQISSTEESPDSARTLRAVVTIFALDQAKGLMIVVDSRNMVHFLENVEPEKMTDLKPGQKVTAVFTEATAVTLKKKT